MRRLFALGAGAVVAAILSGVMPASAGDVMLTRYSEVGFLQLMHLAQNGQLGDDVVNANIGVTKDHVRVELVRTGAPSKVFLLCPKSAAHGSSRYFDIEPGEGAAASDVERLGRALDRVFAENPFQLAPDFFNGSPHGEGMPGFADVWRAAGWRGVGRLLERRMVSLASLRYTIAVIGGLLMSVLASLSLLWGSAPPAHLRG